MILFIFIFISMPLYRPVAVSNPLTAPLRNITIPQTNKGFSTDPKAGSIETRYCQLSESPASTAPREHNDTALR